jgi:hypothetical protein
MINWGVGICGHDRYLFSTVFTVDKLWNVMGDDDGTAVGGQPFGEHTLLVRKEI